MSVKTTLCVMTILIAGRLASVSARDFFCALSGDFVVYDLSQNRVAHKFDYDKTGPSGVLWRLSPDKKRLYYKDAFGDQTIHVFDMESNQEVSALSFNFIPVDYRSLADGALLLSTIKDGDTQFYLSDASGGTTELWQTDAVVSAFALNDARDTLMVLGQGSLLSVRLSDATVSTIESGVETVGFDDGRVSYMKNRRLYIYDTEKKSASSYGLGLLASESVSETVPGIDFVLVKTVAVHVDSPWLNGWRWRIFRPDSGKFTELAGLTGGTYYGDSHTAESAMAPSGLLAP